MSFRIELFHNFTVTFCLFIHLIIYFIMYYLLLFKSLCTEGEPFLTVSAELAYFSVFSQFVIRVMFADVNILTVGLLPH